ncbi:MAG: hypothetical protein IKB38_04255 [Clostridia bacterium]|nr:hypothetical protein [Clostridia bacterium]
MKIAILGFTKLKYMTYMHFYLNKIDTSKDEVHLIYWQRDKNPDVSLPIGVFGHAFDYTMSDAVPLRKKIPGILKYGKFAKKKIKEITPDFLIVLHSTTGISVYKLLRGKYKNKYIFDFRDVTYEKYSFYRKRVARIIEGSALSFTSSDGFRKFLPETEKLLTSHNISNIEFAEQIRSLPKREKHTPIRIAFWGLIRNKAVNENLISRLGGDPRFELHYYGRAQGAMLDMLELNSKKYDNVFFHGEYSPTDRLEMAKNTDIIHNLYDTFNKTSHIAMGNKYYDGVMFGLPQLCTVGSQMGKLVTMFGTGLECDPSDENFADEVYKYYTELDTDKLCFACDKELKRVLTEVKIGEEKIKEVLENAKT